MLPAAATVFFLGLLLGAVLAPAPLIDLLALAFSTGLALSAMRLPGPPAPRARAAALLVAGLVGFASAPPTPGRLPSEGTVVATVERRDDRGAVLLAPAGARVRAALDLDPGATLRVSGTFRPRRRMRNPSPHGDWPLLAPVEHRLEQLADAHVIAAPSRYRQAITALADRLRAGIEASLAPEPAGIARALVLGESGGLEEPAQADIRAAGLSHVLAVSGMHVTLVVGALVLGLRSLLVRVRWLSSRLDVGRLASGLGAPLALVYADLAGSTPSAWRAAVTAAVAWTTVALGRRPAPLAAAALAAMLLGIADPAAALSPGFVLSIASTLAILDTEGRADSLLMEAARLSLRAAIATAPFSLYVFGGLPWLVVLANLVVVPIAAALLLPVALIHAVMAAIDLALAPPTAALFTPLSSAFVGASERFAAISPALVLPPPTSLQGVLLSLGALVLLARLTITQRTIALVLLALGYLGLEVHVRHTEQPVGLLRATFVDVGQGDAALVDLPDGTLLVVDVGGAPNGGPDPGERALVPLLRARRRARIEHLALTHPHPDHYGGLAAVAAWAPPVFVWDSGQAHAEHPEGELAEALDGLVRAGSRLVRPAALCGPPRRLGGAWIEVLWPCPRFDPGWDPNDNSLVLRLRFGRRTFLFAGDAEAHTEASLAGRIGHVDVLKVPHHGSRTSSSEALLDELTPRLAVISSGADNRFGHPHPDVLERFSRRAIPVLRTDEEGGVVVTTDGTRLWADAWSGRHVLVRTTDGR